MIGREERFQNDLFFVLQDVKLKLNHSTNQQRRQIINVAKLLTCSRTQLSWVVSLVQVIINWWRWLWQCTSYYSVLDYQSCPLFCTSPLFVLIYVPVTKGGLWSICVISEVVFKVWKMMPRGGWHKGMVNLSKGSQPYNWAALVNF